MKNIILVTGHNAVRYGAEHNGTKEYFLSEKVIKEVGTIVAKMPSPYFQIMTITTKVNTTLAEKIEMINRMRNIDLAIELHWNSFSSPQVQGSEAFYAHGDDQAWIAAEKYCQVFQEVSGISTRGAKKDYESQYKKLGWCRDVNFPSILVENEFITADAFQEDYYYHVSVVAMIQFLAKYSRR